MIASSLRFVEFLSVVNRQESFDTPDFHLKIALWLEKYQDQPLLLLEAFRDAGKSRLISAYVAWRLRENPNFTCLIVSAKRDRARRNAAYIRALIEGSILTEDLVGADEMWQRQSFTVKRLAIGLNPSVTITSMESDNVGTHCDLIIADDCETRESTRTAEARHKLRERLQEFVALTHHRIFIGQPHGDPSIYTELKSLQHCRSLSFPIYADNDNGERNYTWPERFPAEIVEQKRSEVTRSFWDSQYLLIPKSIDSTTLPVEFIREYDGEIIHDTAAQSLWSDRSRNVARLNGNELVDLVAAYDPAPAREGGDDAIVAVVARDANDQTYIQAVRKLPPVHADRGWADQCDAVIDECIRCGVGRLLVEDNINKALVSELKEAGNRKKVKIRITGIHSTSNKATRIATALETIMAAGKLHAHRSVASSPFYEQARDFPNCCKGKNLNDSIDAVALAVGHLRRLPTQWSGQSKWLNAIGRSGSSRLVTNDGSAGDRLSSGGFRLRSFR